MKDLINIRLEDIRKEHKLTRKALEEISGFKARNIENYERGISKPSKEYIEFISLYFGYKKEYIEGKEVIHPNRDKGTLAILMYQSIFNYDDEKMSKLLNISIENYYKLLNDDLGGASFDLVLDISKKLNIKFNCISYFTLLDEIEANLDDEAFYKRKNDYSEFFKIVKNDLKKRLEIEQSNINGLNITPQYYAQIIKQRNQPEIITPDTQKESIPDKYKEILELLPYASDSFTQNLKNKLLELKKAQQIEDL